MPHALRKLREYHKPACLLALCLLAGCSRPSAEPAPARTAKALLPPPTAPRQGTTFSANPNPAVSSDPSHLAQTTVLWSTTVAHVEVHVESPNGRLFTAGGPNGAVPTAKWVRDGMTFYLQDATAPDPTAPSATLASLIVSVQ